MNKLIIGWHTTIQPSIKDGIKILKNTHDRNDTNYEVSAQIFLKSPMRISKSKFTDVRLYIQN